MTEEETAADTLKELRNVHGKYYDIDLIEDTFFFQVNDQGLIQAIKTAYASNARFGGSEENEEVTNNLKELMDLLRQSTLLFPAAIEDYNNFLWPTIDEKAEAHLSITRSKILEVREKYLDWTLAELYGDLMPPNFVRPTRQMTRRSGKLWQSLGHHL